MKKVYIRTFGCQMNDRDSEIVIDMLSRKGYSLVGSPEEADVILYNTCSVRAHAEERVWGGVGMSKGLKDRKASIEHRGSRIIGVIGCMAKIHGEKIFDRLPHVNFICAPANIYDIPELIEKALKGHRISAIDNESRPQNGTFAEYRQNSISAHVNIMEGCNNFCSYCVVPYARGREVSRKTEDILDEIKCLIDRGFKDITLLGQNVNSYLGSRIQDLGSTGFVELLKEINKIAGDCRIRFMTSHPKDASEELFKAMKDLPGVCEHLHLPVQSGSDRILELMNRKYTCKHYLELVCKLRKHVPECAITTDMIVGFPSETDKDFKKTVDLFKEVEFDCAFIFKYSPRPNTKASQLKDDVPDSVKRERNHTLLKLQDEVALKKNQKLVGQKTEVLFDGPSSARTRTGKIVILPENKELIGKLVDVKITRASKLALIGEQL